MNTPETPTGKPLTPAEAMQPEAPPEMVQVPRKEWERALAGLFTCEQVYLEFIKLGTPPPNVAALLELMREGLGMPASEAPEPASPLVLPGAANYRPPPKLK